MANPSKINQGRTSLCGPASFLYILTRDNPHLYVKYIIDLYERGEATTGGLKVKPGSDCKNYKIPLGGMDIVDWIGLAGLKDSENIFFDYDSITDRFPGITLPRKLQRWFKASGYTQVENKTNLMFDKNLHTLLQAQQRYQSGYRVCLFVGADVFSKPIKGSFGGKIFPDHWVILNSNIQIDEKPVMSLLAKGVRVDDDESLLAKRIDFKVW